MIKYDEVDEGKSGAVDKSVQKSSKSRRIVKESKSFKGLKSLQRSLVRRNVYRSTNPSLVHRYKELELTTELRQFDFLSSFCWAQDSLDTMFGAIIVKAKLVELLMLCRVFPQRS